MIGIEPTEEQQAIKHAIAIASGDGKERRPSGAASPSPDTIAPTIRRVADQAQLVVQIVLTTSSNTVGLRSMLPAPRAAHASSVGGTTRSCVP